MKLFDLDAAELKEAAAIIALSAERNRQMAGNGKTTAQRHCRMLAQRHLRIARKMGAAGEGLLAAENYDDTNRMRNGIAAVSGKERTNG